MTTAIRSLPTLNWDGRVLGFQLPWLALLPLLLIPILGTDAGALNTILFATELCLLAAGVKRSCWIPAALLLSEMSASNYLFGGSTNGGGFQISARLVIACISVPVLVPHIASRLEVGHKAKWTIALGCGFVFVTTFVNSLYAGEDFVLQFLRYIGVGLYYLILIPICIRNRDDLRDLGVLVLGFAAFSGLVGIFQHLHEHYGTPLWQTVPNPGAPGESYTTWEERLLGLSENPIQAGNILMVVGLIALGAVLVTPMSANTKRLIGCVLLMMAGAAYFTFTRSWAIAMAPALLSMALFYKGKYKKEFWLIIIILAGGMWYWSDLKTNRYTATEDDGSAAARPVLWSLGLDIAYDHPWLGVGHDAFLKLSPEYETQSLLDNKNAQDVVGKYAVHNDMINVWLSWGFIALILYVLLAIAIGKNFYDALTRAVDPLLRGLALGGLAALLGYEVNSQFHNLLDSTLTLWILGGLSLALLKLSPQAPPPPRPKTPFAPVKLVRDAKDVWEECVV
ncbi:MAG: O-antigen ligase family protein [Chloroflexota bacterium]